MSRLINFCSVPAALPLPVLDRTSAALQDFQGSKISVMENSLRDRLIEFMCEFEGVSA
jgi:phosphoserine aminotransferase